LLVVWIFPDPFASAWNTTAFGSDQDLAVDIGVCEEECAAAICDRFVSSHCTT